MLGLSRQTYCKLPVKPQAIAQLSLVTPQLQVKRLKWEGGKASYIQVRAEPSLAAWWLESERWEAQASAAKLQPRASLQDAPHKAGEGRASCVGGSPGQRQLWRVAMTKAPKAEGSIKENMTCVQDRVNSALSQKKL